MNAIFAVNSLNGFGADNSMPWPRSSADLKRFREMTTGHTVVMGAKTWLSDMPRPLVNRRNCVLSSTLVDERCEVYSNVTSLLMNLDQDEQVFVIGGATTLWLLRPYIKRIYLTRHTSIQRADITLDVASYTENFELESHQEMDGHTLDIYTRRDTIRES